MSLTSYQTAPPRDKISLYHDILINLLYLKVHNIFYIDIIRNFNLKKFNLHNINFIFKYVFTKENYLYKTFLPGDYCKGVTPDPIPNSAVKPFSANGTLS